jgi:hypothetical protein
VGLLLARVLGASLGFFGFVGVFFWEGCSGLLVGLLGWGASGQVWEVDWGFLLYVGRLMGVLLYFGFLVGFLGFSFVG